MSLETADATVEVKLVYFASARELTGLSEEILKLSTPTTAKGVFSEVCHHHPDLVTIERSILLAINQEYIEGDSVQVNLSHGDEVAFIPPISGG